MDVVQSEPPLELDPEPLLAAPEDDASSPQANRPNSIAPIESLFIRCPFQLVGGVVSIVREHARRRDRDAIGEKRRPPQPSSSSISHCRLAEAVTATAQLSHSGGSSKRSSSPRDQ